MPQVQLNDFTMHYRERGTGGEALVFVAGFVSTHRWWWPALERLSERDYHAYAVDVRGTGRSQAINTGHTLAQYAEDLHQFVEAVGLRRFTLVGHSLGGGVAMQYALQHQERLQALVLANPLAPYGTRLAPEVTDWVNAQQSDPAGIRSIILGEFATVPDPAYVEQMVEDGVAWGRAIYRGTMEDMARFNVSDRLSELAVPTLVTWGDRDGVIPFAGIVDAFTKIPNCGLHIWHGLGHAAPIEAGHEFAALLERFVRESAARAPEAPPTAAGSGA